MLVASSSYDAETRRLSKVDWFAAAKIAAAFLIGIYMIFMRLGLAPLIDPDEGRNASIGMEMAANHYWFLPTYNGIPYLDKPAFFFKLVGFSLSILGRSAFAARLPSALFAFGILCQAFYFCRREYGVRTATLAVIIIATTPLFFAFARYVIFDMTLAFFVCGAIFCGYIAGDSAEKNKAAWSRASAASMAFATLVKGPVGFIIPLLVLSIFFRAEKNKGATRRLFVWQNLLIFFGVVGVWFFGLSYYFPDFPYYGLIGETFLRFTTNDFHRAEPFYFYAFIVAGTFFCWNLVLPEAAITAWKRRKNIRRADLLIIVWFFTVLIFFSFSKSKLPGYVLTVAVAFGMWSARIFAEALENSNGSSTKTIMRAGVAFCVLNFLLAFGGLAYALHPAYFEHKVHLTDTGVFPLIRKFAAPLTAFFFLNGAMTLYAYAKRNISFVFAAFTAMALIIPASMPLYAAGVAHRSDRALIEKIIALPNHPDIVCYECFPSGAPFYLGHSIMVLTNNNGAEIKSNYIPFYLGMRADWPPQIFNLKGLTPWKPNPRKITLILIEPENVESFQTAMRLTRAPSKFSDHYWAVLLPPQRKAK